MGAGVLNALPGTTAALKTESVSLADIAAAAGTPVFVYSSAHVRSQYGVLARALSGCRARIHYSLKANASRGILGVLRSEGAGVDVVSGGELYRARRAGFAPADIVFGGVGKTRREIHEGVAAGLKLLNVESFAELEMVNGVARKAGVTVSVGLRLNPEVAVESAHHFIKTGEKGHKFGIPFDEAADVARAAGQMGNVSLRGVVMHVGSQLRTLDAHRSGAERLLGFVEDIRTGGAGELQYLGLGGGLAVTYHDEPETDVEEFGRIARDAGDRSGLEILVEPGRFLVANAGVLVTRVLYRKRSGGTEHVVVDAGMTELLRPSHYNAFHRIDAVVPAAGRIVADVVGPVCESGDFFARQREVPDVAPGDLLAIQSVGAYGFAMASHYNARPRAAEVLVDGAQWALCTVRETYADLVRHERAHLDWRIGR